jgi:sigma-B regulation protein RsbU (phosphoserine phosphatase)
MSKDNLNTVHKKTIPPNPKIRTEKVTFSVATKIILGITLLILFLACFLDVSTILLLREDKTKYTFKTQSTETFLTGKSLVTSLQTSIDFLRLSLSLINPTKPLYENELQSLQAVINQQHSMVGMRVLTYNKDSGKVCPLSQNWNKPELEKLSLNKDEIFLTEDEIRNSIESLEKNGFFILKYSSLDQANLVAVVTTDVDLNNKDNRLVPLAIGFISISSLNQISKSSSIAVFDENGKSLFNSDTAPEQKNNQLYNISAENNAPNGTTKFSENNVEYLGSYYKPGLGLTILSKTPFIKAMQATYILTEKFILLGLIVLCIGIIVAFVLANSITAPLYTLYLATKKIGKGNFNTDLKIKSKDEIGSLSTSFVSMTKELHNLIQDKVKSVHLEKEVEIASAVQQTLIPEKVFKTSHIDGYSHYQPAAQCGGDIWGFFEHQDKGYFMIADATGHGIPSALITASARSCSSVIQQLLEDKKLIFSASDILHISNRVIQDASKGKIFMTMFVGIVDYKTKTIQYSNAGHNPPWLFSQKGVMKSLHIPSPRLGEKIDANFVNKEIPFQDNDLFVLYTDGLIEGTNKEDEQFGKKQVKVLIEENLKNPDTKFHTPKSIVGKLVSHFSIFNGQKPLDDDVTLVVAKLGGSSE